MSGVKVKWRKSKVEVGDERALRLAGGVRLSGASRSFSANLPTANDEPDGVAMVVDGEEMTFTVDDFWLQGESVKAVALTHYFGKSDRHLLIIVDVGDDGKLKPRPKVGECPDGGPLLPSIFSR